jgi:hypothetical protein
MKLITIELNDHHGARRMMVVEENVVVGQEGDEERRTKRTEREGKTKGASYSRGWVGSEC